MPSTRTKIVGLPRLSLSCSWPAEAVLCIRRTAGVADSDGDRILCCCPVDVCSSGTSSHGCSVIRLFSLLCVRAFVHARACVYGGGGTIGQSMLPDSIPAMASFSIVVLQVQQVLQVQLVHGSIVHWRREGTSRTQQSCWALLQDEGMLSSYCGRKACSSFHLAGGNLISLCFVAVQSTREHFCPPTLRSFLMEEGKEGNRGQCTCHLRVLPRNALLP